MKRVAIFAVSLLLFFIAGCGSDHVQIKLYTPKTFTPGQPFAMQFKILDSKGTPVTGAKVTADLNMKNMDHGTVSIVTQEIGDGMYVGQANLMMNGDWVATVKVDHGGKSDEEDKSFSIDVKTKESAHKVTKHVELPNFALIDQNGQQVTKKDLIGKTVAMTFTYVNCTDPNACPVLLGNFSKLQQEIKANNVPTNRILLVSVSIDPKNDTPKVLKKHAQEMNFDTSYLKMLTGDLSEIVKVTNPLGEHFEKKDAEVIHDNKTLVFDQTGTLTHEFTGSYIDQEELFQVVAGHE
ncbi:SCO family protein [Bacillus sp. EB600]|uniref:SCO family protein n=1 Tax=Bacillus sp. EB600 TaxID=2806345 RepID=UPI002108CBBC|nr:SCO family protein [Bacillus sp. EB600]MCQ6280114.1 SCO family protein [Bacillus sp. EB600]